MALAAKGSLRQPGRVSLEMDTPTVGESPWRRRALVTAIFVVATALIIRRSPSQLATRLPGDLGDSVLQIWIVRWTGHALVHSPRHLFDGNIFWPLRGTVAYADPLLTLAPMYAAFYGLTHNWILSWNMIWLGMIGLNLGATYSLTRWLTGRTDAAIFAALPAGFSAYVLGQAGHPQLQMIGLLPLALLLLFKLVERPRYRVAALLGLTNIAIALGALYIAAGYALAVAVILTGLIVLMRGRLGWRLVGCLVLSGAMTLVAAPSFIAYHNVSQTFGKRPLAPEWGLRPRDIVRPAPGSYLYKSLSKNTDKGSYERHLFPGFTTMLLAFVGVGVLGARRRRGTTRPEPGPPTPPDRPSLLALLVLAGAVMGVLAVGATARGPWTPWRFVYDHIGPLASVRVTARLAAVSILAGAVLAGVGLAWVLRRISHPAGAVALTCLASVMVLAELAAPVPYTHIASDRGTLAVYQALSHRPSGAVVELPIFEPVSEPSNWAYAEASRMVWSTIDFHPRVNGYSGYIPVSWYDDVLKIRSLPDPNAFATLKSLQVRFLILHLGIQTGIRMYTVPQARTIMAGLPASATVSQYGDNYLVDLGQP